MATKSLRLLAFAWLLGATQVLLGLSGLSCNSRPSMEAEGQDLRAGTGGGGGDLGGVVMPMPDATLSGQVFAPEGTIPIASALVYLTGARPAPMPEGLHCDRCVRLAEGTPHTETGPDGRFTLKVAAGSGRTLVVQKGGFRRMRSLDVQKGDNPLPKEFTTLPGKSAPDMGDEIPKMAVRVGAWDKIEVTLARLGLGKLRWPGVDKTSLSFDLFEVNLLMPNPDRNPDKLLKDWNTLKKYQVVFIPCTGSDGTTCNDLTSGDPTVQKNLQQFVAEGGKLYVTDYSYDFVRQIFPGYVDWIGQGGKIGSACQQGAYNAEATVEDKGLKDWLSAQGINNFTLRENWTIIDKVNTVATMDLDGKPAMVKPKVWVSGQTGGHGLRPSTISFVRSCGRVLFSTYHTEAGLSAMGLLAQERALLYVLLETVVCIDPVIG